MSDIKRGKQVCKLINRAMPCFIKNLNHIVHRYREAGYNLNGNQIKVINGVKILESISPAELSRILDMPKGSLTTIISSLVEQDLLAKTYSQSDPRRYTVSVTTTALKVLEMKDASDAVKYQEIFAAMPESDFNKVEEGLTILMGYLDLSGDRHHD